MYPSRKIATNVFFPLDSVNPTLGSSSAKRLIPSTATTFPSACSSGEGAQFRRHHHPLRYLYINSTVFLTSPNYPSNYLPNRFCQWRFIADSRFQIPDNRIQIEFNSFSTQECCDHLTIYGSIIEEYEIAR